MRRPLAFLALLLTAVMGLHGTASAQGPAPVPAVHAVFNGADLAHTPGIAFRVVKTVKSAKQVGGAAVSSARVHPETAYDGGNWLYTTSVVGYYYYSNTGAYVCTYGYAQAYTNTAAYVTVGDGLFLNGVEVFWGYASSSGPSGYAVETTGCYVQPYWTQAINDAYSSAYFLSDGRSVSDTAANYWFRTLR